MQKNSVVFQILQSFFTSCQFYHSYRFLLHHITFTINMTYILDHSTALIRLLHFLEFLIYFLDIIGSIRPDWPWSLSPGSLASNGYNGHTFWDGETWMYPSLLMLHPDLAESMLRYRYNHIAGAKLKAQSYNAGYQGTMFPWESAFTGEEVCPISAPTGQLEQHISGDIAFAVMQYRKKTNESMKKATFVAFFHRFVCFLSILPIFHGYTANLCILLSYFMQDAMAFTTLHCGTESSLILIKILLKFVGTNQKWVS